MTLFNKMARLADTWGAELMPLSLEGKTSELRNKIRGLRSSLERASKPGDMARRAWIKSKILILRAELAALTDAISVTKERLAKAKISIVVGKVKAVCSSLKSRQFAKACAVLAVAQKAAYLAQKTLEELASRAKLLILTALGIVFGTKTSEVQA